MKANANSMSSFNTNQERARRRRNRNVTMVLFGIVLLFLLCHIGEVAISIYELADVLDGERSMFPQWASNTIILNHLLIVINSSLNFVIYCKDVVFRYVRSTYIDRLLIRKLQVGICAENQQTQRILVFVTRPINYID